MPPRLDVRIEKWPIAGGFTISRGTKTEAVTVVAELVDGIHTGRGECTPYPRYGETPEGVAETILGLTHEVQMGLDRHQLVTTLPAGAARNALDCAFWDLEAKRSGRRAADLAGLPPLEPQVTCTTISLGTPEEMAEAARKKADWPLLKVKLGKPGDAERIAAVREAAPKARIVVDANEGWAVDELPALMRACEDARIELVEQPLPSDDDAALERLERSVVICADESAHDRLSLPKLKGRYDALNIKLDKTGGLTEALLLAEEAEATGLKIMVGCMVATSLAMAPAMLVAQRAQWVDLDGPLILSQDREPGLVFDGATISPPDPDLWG
ncbi:N-acetyl-D-Glu racemase DgcA [Lutibaculum baratangense]|uniref:Dipeptide epimerase n=1 Tax=Lutibaculum baratangense AMV1 TaxID=631454 RepID=V4QWT8_9HYPH|nr:N-acetyl-D-Glu racemase DgcA [Lutibaculum baratangense]ESR24237.1 Muconate cycloisomerase [Lutibaculum baratangense AMV1]